MFSQNLQHGDVALILSLEDQFPELSPDQVLAALQRAGGTLEAARELCSELVAIEQHVASSSTADHTGSLTQLQTVRNHRKWWPKSEFCPTVPPAALAHDRFVANSTRSSSSSSDKQHRLLVPHQVQAVLKEARAPSPSAQPVKHQHQQPPKTIMQPALGSIRNSGRQVASRQSPAALALRQLAGSAADAPCSTSSSSAGSPARHLGNILQHGTAAPSTPGSGMGSTTGSGGGAPSAAQPTISPPPQQQQRERPSLHPHYAAVFLTDKSRQQLVQHVPPLHEVVSADHMTLAYKPSPEECMQLPLGREAALFVVGVASDYRAQAVAVEHPSWLPFLSESTPHVTVSVGEEVPAREAGDVTAAALEHRNQLAPVAKLKLLQGVVGVQLSDGSRVFSAGELQSRLAAAAQAQKQQQQPAAKGGPKRILQRDAAVPAGVVADCAPPEPATEPAVPLPEAAAAPSTSNSKSSSSNLAAWDLNSLMDQLHLAEQPAEPSGGRHGGGTTSGAPAPTQPQPQAQQPRRGLLKLPAQVAAELAAPSRGEDAGSATSSSNVSIRGPIRPLLARRAAHTPQPAHRQQQQQPQHERQHSGAGDGSEGYWADHGPAAPVAVLGKSVAEEAVEAAAGDAPLDMVSSLAFLLPPERGDHTSSMETAAAAAAEAARSGAAGDQALPSPGGAAAGASGSGYETSSSSVASLGPGYEEGGGLDGGADVAAGSATATSAIEVDPELQQLLHLQFPALHTLVVETALRMHGGSLPAAAQFLSVLDQQQQELAAQQGGSGAGPGQGPQQPTLGAYLQHLIPESAASPSSPATAAAGAGAAGACIAPHGSSSSTSFADSSYDIYQPAAAAPVAGSALSRKQRFQLQAAQRENQSTGRGWQQQQAGGGSGSGRGGKGAKAPRRASAGDDPMSVTERQAMNLHLTAKRLYTQASQEAYATGQVALAKELQATARSHADAANSARRRANASAFRSTNASVMNSFTLDLHGQHVDEALQSLERYLLTLGGLGHPGGVMLQVITGLGRHSVGNQPRVLPAVVRYLSDAGYKFDSEEDNPGVINVMIGC